VRAVVMVAGGFGNQLFQLAKALDLCERFTVVEMSPNVKRHGNPRKLFIEDFLDIPSKNLAIHELTFAELIRLRICRQLRKFSWIPLHKICSLLGVSFDDTLISPRKNFNFFNSVIFEGYWQTSASVSKSRDLLVPKISNLLNQKVSSHFAKRFESVKLVAHCRGTDYVEVEENRKLFGLLDPNYYTRALDSFVPYDHNFPLYVVTDDEIYAKKIFGEMTFAAIIGPKSTNEWEALYLMANAQLLVISNSSFAWWGGWLCLYNGGQVAMPEMWFKDISKARSLRLPDAIEVVSSWI
jgi:hypothetical protein